MRARTGKVFSERGAPLSFCGLGPGPSCGPWPQKTELAQALVKLVVRHLVDACMNNLGKTHLAPQAKHAVAGALLRSSPLGSSMVKEGHDSTVRPKIQTFEYDNGRLFLDAWAADGKPNFSRKFIGWSRVANVLGCAAACGVICMSDWGPGETCFSPVQRVTRSWWASFSEMDVEDVKKARSVEQLLPLSFTRAK